MCKELPVIPFNKVVDPKRIIQKMEGRGGGGAQGVADPKKQPTKQKLMALAQIHFYMRQNKHFRLFLFFQLFYNVGPRPIVWCGFTCCQVKRSGRRAG
jgi:hypothetical protein